MASSIKAGDWVTWKAMPAIVVQTVGDSAEITIWVKTEELKYVPKH